MLTRYRWLSLGLGALSLLCFACSDEPDLPGGTTSSSSSAASGGNGQGGSTNNGTPTTTTANGGNGQGGNGQGGAGANYAVCDSPPATYPTGPYGNEPGDVFAPLALQGWTSTNPMQRIDLEPFGDYTMDDLRAEHPSTFVMFHLSGMF